MSSEREPVILTSIENGIQKVVLNRPAKKNAINGQMYGELIKILNESAENEAVTVLVITGNGDFYSSGNDFINSMTDDSSSPEDKMKQLEIFINLLITYPKLLIAVVNGPAIGISATTLALFDIVYASENAYFLTPFAKLGLSPEGCSSYTFPRIMGPSRAGEMLFFGEKMTAREAAQVGFISKVYRDDNVNDIWTHIGKVSSLSKESLVATKRLLTRWNKDSLIEINKQELVQLTQMYSMPNFMENMIKFMSSKSKI